MKLLSKKNIFITILIFLVTINVSALDVAPPSEKIKIKEELYSGYQVSYRLLEKEQIILFNDIKNKNNYSLAFNNDVTNDYILDYYISFDKYSIPKDFQSNKIKYITFVPEKDLGANVKVTISVKDLFKDNTKVEVYRLKNNETKKIGKTIKVKDGYVSFNTKIGYKYFIRKEKKYAVLESVKFMNVVIISLLIVSVLLILKTLIFTKK